METRPVRGPKDGQAADFEETDRGNGEGRKGPTGKERPTEVAQRVLVERLADLLVEDLLRSYGER